MVEETKSRMTAPWDKRTKEALGKRPDAIQSSYDMQPETPVAE